jgi:23S rRNA (adenine2503-C2)-methyltransferase
VLITGQGREALEKFMREFGQPAFRLEQLLDWIFKKRVRDFEEMRNLPAGLRAALAERYHFGGLETVRCLGSKDTTRKFLFRLPDGALIETVLIPAGRRLIG